VTALPAALATAVLVTAGVVFFVAGTVGLLRFPDAMTRLHALSKADNLGLGLIVLGLLPQAASVSGALKLLAIWLLTQVAGATVTQVMARAIWRGASPPGASPSHASSSEAPRS
jgi:multicomponent Na+:H+ antiporter subunit G